MHVSVLVPRGAVALSCIEGAFTCFRRVNELLASAGRPEAFEVVLVGLDTTPVVYEGGFAVVPGASIDTVPRTDLVVIPAVNGDADEAIDRNRGFFPWIEARHREGAEVASLCVGAFLLAATGLLDGQCATTHWSRAEEFQRRFPAVNVVSSSIITDQNRLSTSGGALSFWNLLLYLVEKHTDRATAALASRYFEVEWGREDQRRFLVFQGQKDHGDPVVLRAQEHLEENYPSRLSVADLGARLAVGLRSLERRFKRATGNTLLEYHQRVRVEAAKRELERGVLTLVQVADAVGYADPKAFRKVFQQATGMTPSAYRDHFHGPAATAAAS